jgi:hypothetical protein
MSWFPDMGNKSMVAEGDHVRAIGWLSSDQPFPQGEVPAAFFAHLEEFVRLANESAEALWFGAFAGLHTCEFCYKARGYGNFGVPAGQILFVAPEMVAHYIGIHNYKPPDEFVAAVFQSPLPGTDEYRALAEPFGRLHEQAWKRQDQQRIEYAGRWAFEQGSSEEAIRAAAFRFFGYSSPEMCQRIRQSMPVAELGVGPDRRPFQ